MVAALALACVAGACVTPPGPGPLPAETRPAPIVRDCPAITQQPQDVLAYIWDSVSLEVVSSGAGTLTYQWRKDGVAIVDGGHLSGAQTPALRISPGWRSDNGTYDVVVSDGVCQVTSREAEVEFFCYPDCHGAGALNLAQFGCFLTRYALHHPYADCNRDGVLNIADFGCFQSLYALGCPF